MKRETETVSSKIPKELGDVMRRMIQRDKSLTKSEFIRTVLYEKAKHDVPLLLEEMFKEDEEE